MGYKFFLLRSGLARRFGAFSGSPFWGKHMKTNINTVHSLSHFFRWQLLVSLRFCRGADALAALDDLGGLGGVW
jgi:hypothetical protein